MRSLADARREVLALARPGAPMPVPLPEALGLRLAEDVVADVDLPPFDRAAVDGYAVRASDATADARLKVVGPRGGDRPVVELAIGPRETAHVATGDPLPAGADAVLRTEDTRPEPGVGAPREVLALRCAVAGLGVVARGYFLRAGSTVATAGAAVRLPMVGLLASQGCTHPVCHRRTRVAVLAVGDHLVGAGDAPVMHRERNAAGPTAVLACLQRGAVAHDLGPVPEADLRPTLARALTAPVVIVLGAFEGAVPRALARAGVSPVFSGLSLHPGKRVGYGVVRDPAGEVAHHVFHMAPSPVGVFTAATLLVLPLIDRLHGALNAEPAPLRAVWEGPAHRPTDDREWAVPVTLALDPAGRLRATGVEHRGKDDLAGFARAEGFALLPPRAGPWNGGESVEVAPIGGWSNDLDVDR
jgi:molybdopterin molybdotransferase